MKDSLSTKRVHNLIIVDESSEEWTLKMVRTMIEKLKKQGWLAVHRAKVLLDGGQFSVAHWYTGHQERGIRHLYFLDIHRRQTVGQRRKVLVGIGPLGEHRFCIAQHLPQCRRMAQLLPLDKLRQRVAALLPRL